MSSQDRKVTKASRNAIPGPSTNSLSPAKDPGLIFKPSCQDEKNANPSQVNQRNRDAEAQRRALTPSGNNILASPFGGETNGPPRAPPNREQQPVVGYSPGTGHIERKPVPLPVPSSSSRRRNAAVHQGRTSIPAPVSLALGAKRTEVESELDRNVYRATPPLSTPTRSCSPNIPLPILHPAVNVVYRYVDQSVQVNVEIANHPAYMVPSVSVTFVEDGSVLPIRFDPSLSSPRSTTKIPANVVCRYVDDSVEVNVEIANHPSYTVHSVSVTFIEDGSVLPARFGPNPSSPRPTTPIPEDENFDNDSYFTPKASPQMLTTSAFHEPLPASHSEQDLQAPPSILRRLINVKSGNVAFLPDANLASEVVASFIQHKPGEKWWIRKVNQDSYFIRNEIFPSYAGAGPNSVIGKVGTRDQWILRETRVHGTYTISPSTNPDLYWALQDEEIGTPIKLRPGRSNEANHWRFV